MAPLEGRIPDHMVAFPVEPGPAAKLRAKLDDLSLSNKDREELSDLLAELPADPVPRVHIPWDSPLDKRLAEDPQMAKALTLLGAAANP